MTRLILDSNVWSNIAKRGCGDDLEVLEERSDLEMVVPPSILLEVLRTPHATDRALIVDVVTSRAGKRVHPPTEAKQEADELITAFARRCKGFLLRAPIIEKLRALEAFWTRRFWQQARKDPAEMAARADQMTDNEEDAAILMKVQNRNRDELIAAGAPRDRPLWKADLTGQPDEVIAGWGGQPIDFWRLENASFWWQHLVVEPRRVRRAGGDTTMADWVGARAKLSLIRRDRESWNRFWYEQVAPDEVPRNWLRAVLPWAQMQTKLGDGNPRDAQHAAYLFDCDLFITGDRRYADALETLRPLAPRAFARVVKVKGGRSPVSELAAALAADPT